MTGFAAPKRPWVFITVSLEIVWNTIAATDDQLHRFPSLLHAFNGPRLGVIFLANCNDSICLNGINFANNANVSIGLDRAIEPSFLGFLDKKLYLGYSLDGMDDLLAIDFNPACKVSKCPIRTISVGELQYRLALGTTDTIGNRIFLFYHKIHSNSTGLTRMCAYTPKLKGIDCIFDFDGIIRHAVYDSVSSTLYYTVCSSGICQAFRLVIDASRGFPLRLSQPKNLQCVSNQISTPAFTTWYIASNPIANLYFPVKPEFNAYTWDSHLQACLPGSKAKLPPETSAVFTTRIYTIALLPNDTILVRNSSHSFLLQFYEKIHLLTTLSYGNDYSFDKNCLVPDLLSPEIVLVPIYKNVAEVNVRRPYIGKVSSIDDYFRSKCQNISLPHFYLFVTSKPVGALNDGEVDDSFAPLGYVNENGIVTLTGLQVGQHYIVNVYWVNKYTRQRWLVPTKLSQHLNWTVESYPKLANLTLAPTTVSLNVSGDSSGDHGESKGNATVVGTLTGAVGLLLAAISIGAFWAFRKRKQYKTSVSSQSDLVSQEASSGIQMDLLGPRHNRRRGGEDMGKPYTPFLMKLEAAANELSELQEFSMGDVEILKEIGSGAFGTVFEAVFLDSSPINSAMSCRFALKAMANVQEMITEAKVMANLNHPNIVEIYGICLDPEYPHIALEYMAGGSLLDHLRSLRSNNIALAANDQVAILKNVASALCYLEGRKIVHRDVAARNCLLSGGCPGTSNVKLADFGMTRPTPKDYYRLKNSVVLPIRWLAPECITLNVFTSKTDVWAFGILTWEIITLGLMPYPEKTDQEVVDYIRNGGHPIIPVEDSGIFHLMHRCWEVNPDERISATDVCQYLNALEERIFMCPKDNKLYFQLPTTEANSVPIQANCIETPAIFSTASVGITEAIVVAV